MSIGFATCVAGLFALSLVGMWRPTPWSVGLVPHATCWQNRPLLVWGTAIADAIIWLAYVAIPTLILLLVRRGHLPYPGAMYLAAAFIVACGWTHYFDAVTTWWPIYYAAMLEKWVTACVSTLFVFVGARGLRWLEANRMPLADALTTASNHLRQTNEELARTLDALTQFLGGARN